MATFRFRAAAALELRAREERDALLVLSQAQGRFRERDGVLAAALAAFDRARDDEQQLQGRGADHGLLMWHRNWIVGLAGAVERARRDLDTERAAMHAAEQAWWHARRRTLALEKLRDRARARFLAAEHRAELQAIDELARIRYVTETWRTES
jgi:flagellar export protein FliJ